jgi:signal transduction histidine kinase
MRAPLSVRTHLVGLIFGVLLPPLIFGSYLVIRSAEHEQGVLATSVRNRTRMAAAATEDQLNNLRARLFLLAGRLSLESGDLSKFHARAKEEFGAMTVTLNSADGQEIVDTSVQYGEPLPDNSDPAEIRSVANSQRPDISDISFDPRTNRPVVTINVPMTRDGKLVYVLSLNIISTLPMILRELDLPDGWVAAIFDRQGHIIGRNLDADRFIGVLARPAFAAQMRAQNEGEGPGLSREGVPLFNAFAHTGPDGWVINVGIPRDTLLAPIRQTTWSLILLGCATVAIAAALAVMIARRIAAPIVGLVPLAQKLGNGEPAESRPTGLAEANVVARSMMEASERLHHAATERHAATEALRQSEQTHRALAVDLARSAEERTALLNRVVVTQEEERKRIARELHDNLAQYLTALRLKLDRLSQGTESGPPPRQTIAELGSLIGELGRVVNRLAFELRPVALDELGLHRAVDHYLEEWAERADLQVDTEIALKGRELPAAVETTLFRVLQEAVTNVLRHANATHVGVILEATNDAVRLIVEDDGKGFPPGNGESRSAAGARLGLIGMRERLALLNGELDVESAPGQGTTLFMSIPLARPSGQRPPPAEGPLLLKAPSC